MKTPRLLVHDGPELVDDGCHQAVPATDARLLFNPTKAECDDCEIASEYDAQLDRMVSLRLPSSIGLKTTAVLKYWPSATTANELRTFVLLRA
jgi:hypothetical protein